MTLYLSYLFAYVPLFHALIQGEWRSGGEVRWPSKGLQVQSLGALYSVTRLAKVHRCCWLPEGALYVLTFSSIVINARNFLLAGVKPSQTLTFLPVPSLKLDWFLRLFKSNSWLEGIETPLHLGPLLSATPNLSDLYNGSAKFPFPRPVKEPNILYELSPEDLLSQESAASLKMLKTHTPHRNMVERKHLKFVASKVTLGKLLLLLATFADELFICLCPKDSRCSPGASS